MPKGKDIDLEGLFKELGLNQAKQDHQKNDFDNRVNGTIAVKNGVLTVNYPKNYGKYPTIAPGKYVRIFVNKQEIFKPTVITQEDEIVFEPANVKSGLVFDLEVSEDNLKAYLIISCIKGSEYIIQDQEPVTDLILNGILNSNTLPNGPSIAEVKKLLQEKKIIYGINEAVIYGAIENIMEGEQKFEIASGIPVDNGVDGKILFKFMEKQSKEPEHTNPYQKKVLSSVSPGEVLAVKIPPQEGKPGVDIFGNELIPTLPKEAVFKIGEGVQLIEQGTIAIATIAGRPHLEGMLFKVLPCYVLNQNVDVEIGNFEFNGDIVIHGDVLDGFKVVASGNIEVYGGVLHAELEAGGNILVTKSVVSSQLIAGRTNSSLRKLKTAFQELVDLFDQLLDIVSQVKKAEAFKMGDLANGQGRLILLLIQSRFTRIPELLKEMVDLVTLNGAIFDDRLKAILEGLHKKFSHYGPLEIKDTDEIIRISDAMSKVNSNINPDAFVSADIYVYFAQKSFLSASGSIVITGNGCISSELDAGLDITIKGSPGIVRGGKLSGYNINVNEIGSTAVVKVFVELKEEGSLEVNLVYPTLLIKHKKEVFTIEEDSRLVKAFINKNGLQVEKLKAY